MKVAFIGLGRMGRGMAHRILDGRASVLLHDAKDGLDRLPDRGRFAPSSQRLRDRIQHRDAAARVSRDHGVADASQRYGESRFVTLARRSSGTLGKQGLVTFADA